MIVNCAIVTNAIDYLPNGYINRVRYPMLVEDLIAKVEHNKQTVIIVDFLNENFTRLGIDGQYIQMYIKSIGRQLEVGDVLTIGKFNIRMQIREIVKL